MKTEIFCNIFLGFSVGIFLFLFGLLIFDLVSDAKRMSKIEERLKKIDEANEKALREVSKWEF